MPDPLCPATAHLQEVPFTNITGVGASGEGGRALWATVGSKLQGEVLGGPSVQARPGAGAGGTRSNRFGFVLEGAVPGGRVPNF